MAGDYPRVADVMPALSPDGTELLFMRARDGFNLFVMPFSVDSEVPAEPRQLTKTGGVGAGAWSGDGLDIIYPDGSTDEARLQRIRADGSSEPVDLGIIGLNPAISGHGNRLAFQPPDEGTSNIWRIPIAGQEQIEGRMEKVIVSSRLDGGAQFSPDDARIAFVSSRSGSREIWLADADGSNPRKLTDFGGPRTGTPRFAPNSRELVFNSVVDAKNFELWILSIDGGAPRRFTEHPAQDIMPSWSRDGQWIYFTSDRSGQHQIWKKPSAEGEAVQVTQSGGSGAVESLDGEYVYYVNRPDGPMSGAGWGQVWRVPTSGGPEEVVFDGQAYTHCFAVAQGGFYFVPPESPDGQWALRYFDLTSGEPRTVWEHDRRPNPGCSLSPDGRSMLVNMRQPEETDLMMVEDFR